MRSNLRQLMICTGSLALTAMLLLPFVGLAQATGPDDFGETRVTTASPPTSPAISAEQATALALNDLAAIGGGYEVRHPLHIATFTPAGLTFTPRRGGPTWSWKLTYASADHVDLGAVAPRNATPNTVAYPRGGLVEQYLFQPGSMEQQFVIPAPLTLDGADLVIAGAVSSDGAFETTLQGWLWCTAEGVVSLGDVYVFDATGRELPATMAVTANETRIVVDGAALARAIYPVTVDPEVGTNDFRISDMGPNGDDSYDAYGPEVAYNSTHNEYLVVWGADDNATGADIDEIYGQRINAATGAEVGNNDFRISDMGATDGATEYIARTPVVAYNSTNDEYLVVWRGDDDTSPLVDGQDEIFGQRIYGDRSLGDEVGNNDFRISNIGAADGDTVYDAREPAVAYNSTNNEYLVVWTGDDGNGYQVNDANEIFGQRIYGDRSSGDQVGNNDFRISDMGTTDDTNYDATAPAVAYNSTNNEYLVVWQGDDNTGSLVNNEYEIFCQRIYGDRTSGDEVGTNDFRISDMGGTGDDNYDTDEPAVAYNSTSNEYLVVWESDDNTGSLVDGEYEIFGQRINATTGAEVGNNDFRLSDMGGTGDTAYSARMAAVTYDNANNEYLVMWRGDDNTAPLVDGEYEIFGQRVYGNRSLGDEVGADLRLSDMGPDGDADFDADYPQAAYNSTNNEYLVVWEGDDNTAPLVDNEGEIFGQRWETPSLHDLSIVKAVDPAIAGPGGDITYTLSFINKGTATATNVLITDSVPISVTGLSYQEPGVAITATGSISYVWQVQNLAPGEGGIITITGALTTPLAASTFTNTAHIACTEVESDTTNNSGAAGVTVSNVAPLANDDSGADYKTGEDSAFTTADVLFNDDDQNGDTLSVADVYTSSTQGSVTDNGDGTFDYDPDGQFEYLAMGEQADDTFTYVVSDGTLTDTATVTITIDGANDAPTANDDSGVDFTTDEDSTFTTGNVLNNDMDPDTSDVRFVTSFDAAGTIGLVSNYGDGTFGYDPNGQFEALAVGEQADDTFTYVVSDGTVTDTATVTITVDGVNDAPTIANIPNQRTAEGVPVGPVPFTVSDVDTDPVILALAGDSSDTALVPLGNIVFGGSGADRTVTITPAMGMTGTATITITVSDGELEASDSFILAVSVNTPPEFTSAPNLAAMVGVTYTYAITTYDADAGDALTVTAPTKPSWLTLTRISTRTAVLDGVPPSTGEVPVVLHVTDGEDSATQAFTITVSPANQSPVADAGGDRTVAISATVTLDGSGSTDPDGDPLTYDWAQTGGTAVSFNRTLSRTTFTAPPTADVLTFILTVTDTGNLTGTDTVVITVTEHTIYLPLVLRND